MKVFKYLIQYYVMAGRADSKGKKGGKDLRSKAKQAQIKKVMDMIADESLETLANLIGYGVIVRKTYRNIEKKKMKNLIESLKKEKLKKHALLILIYKYLNNELSKEEFLKRVLAIYYA